MNTQEKINLYKEYKKQYYLGSPLISDLEFDAFESELLQEVPDLLDLIGYEDQLNKFEHPTQMTSLNKFNIYDDSFESINQDIVDFLQKHKNWKVSPKYDGNSVNVIYKNGKLFKVLSRGDGITGRDYTNKFKLPKTIQGFDDKVVELRGEALIPLDVFQKYANDFKNPRNFVAGVLNRIDINDTINDIVIEFFEVRVDSKIQNANIIKELKLTTKNSFNEINIENGAGNFIKVYNVLKEYRKITPYYLDGFVIKAPEEERNSTVNGNPKDCVAIKFPPEEAVTKINSYEFNVGKFGVVTPVFIFEPVLLDGTLVKRASAHNIKYILENKYYIGSEVVISKSGDIIPQVRRLVKQTSTPSNPKITNCPICNSILRFDGVNLFCDNQYCFGRNVKLLEGIKIFGVNFFGGSTIEKLYKSDIKCVEDFFSDKFSTENLTMFDFKEGRHLQKIKDEIDNIKEIDLWRVIYSLQFKNVGKTISIEYAKKMVGIPYSFTSMDRSAINGINEDRIKNFITILKNKGINILNPFIDDKITVEMTGNVNYGGYKTKADFIQDFNATHTKLDKTTNYLITDSYSSSSSKMTKAKKLGVEIITYEDFYNKFHVK